MVAILSPKQQVEVRVLEPVPQYNKELLKMRKSVKREYELDRSYDYGEAYGFKNTKRNVGFVKRRSHKRLRQQLKPKKDIDMPRVV